MSRREVSLLFLSSLVDCECLTYRGFSPYANFITSNFITTISHKAILRIYALCLGLFYFISAMFQLFLPFLSNAIFFQHQKWHQARILCTPKITSYNEKKMKIHRILQFLMTFTKCMQGLNFFTMVVIGFEPKIWFCKMCQSVLLLRLQLWSLGPDHMELTYAH